MPKLFSIIAILLLITSYTKAQHQLSEQAEISVLTCDPGDELYSTFGHSAIRIKDYEKQLDLVFNYGTFDFSTPNFYVKFTRGTLDYMLSISPFKYYIKSYKKENRGVREQILNLNSKQKQAVYEYLMNNAKPENKFYHYDFLFDNCATRVADVLIESTEDDIKIGRADLGNDSTFRLMLWRYLQTKDWTRVGINMLMGLPADQTVTNREASFLPDFLESLITNSEIKQNGKYIPLVKEQKILFKPNIVNSRPSSFLSPKLIFWFLFVLFALLSLYEFVKKKSFREIDRYFLAILGLAGFLFVYTWFGTEHDAMVNNLNTVWAFPLHFFAAFFLTNKKRATAINTYFKIYSIGLILFLGLYIFRPIFFDPIILPITLILLMRSILIFTKNDNLSQYSSFLPDTLSSTF